MQFKAARIMVALMVIISSALGVLGNRAGGARIRGARAGAQAWGSVTRSPDKPDACPVDYDVPDADGKPSWLHVDSVHNFVDQVDPWWNQDRVIEFEQPGDGEKPYKIGPSPVAGCGMFATRKIAKGEKVGVVWVPDDHWRSMVHFSPWFGRAINHCPAGQSTTVLIAQADNSVWTVAKRDIEVGEELTGDYNEAHQSFPNLVQGANPAWRC